SARRPITRHQNPHMEITGAPATTGTHLSRMSVLDQIHKGRSLGATGGQFCPIHPRPA
ncbi:MAG: hypothetical protein GX880_04425, partial [Methanomicrobiales archaeon]|nr:hypothetical protein [Methanomicrobiales archaeon]